jgi:hypothetical protein
MNWYAYRHFKADEFTCKCGCGKNNMSDRHMDMLEQAREIANIPFKINSGSRCDTHNIYVGGNEFSEHLSGEGCDIRCVLSADRWKIINALLSAGFRRIGIGTTFIHAGSSASKPQDVIWKY